MTEHNWPTFWATIKKDGISEEQAHTVTGIKSFKEFLEAYPAFTLQDLSDLIYLKLDMFEAATPPLYEAPASANFKADHPAGFIVQFTIRNHEVSTVLKRVDQLAKHLIDKGWKTNGRAFNAPPPPPVAKVEVEMVADPGFCTIHQVQMKRREKDGQIWYSHKAGEEWCRGKEA